MLQKAKKGHSIGILRGRKINNQLTASVETLIRGFFWSLPESRGDLRGVSSETGHWLLSWPVYNFKIHWTVIIAQKNSNTGGEDTPKKRDYPPRLIQKPFIHPSFNSYLEYPHLRLGVEFISHKKPPHKQTISLWSTVAGRQIVPAVWFNNFFISRFLWIISGGTIWK